MILSFLIEIEWNKPTENIDASNSGLHYTNNPKIKNFPWDKNMKTKELTFRKHSIRPCAAEKATNKQWVENRLDKTLEPRRLGKPKTKHELRKTKQQGCRSNSTLNNPFNITLLT